MTSKQATAKLNRIPIAIVAEHLGLSLDRKHRGVCPSGHGGRSRNHFSLNTRKNYFKCFHCGEWGGPVKLWRFTYQVGQILALKEMSREFLNDAPINRQVQRTIQERQLERLIEEYRDLIWQTKSAMITHWFKQQNKSEMSEADYDTRLLMVEGAYSEIDRERNGSSLKTF